MSLSDSERAFGGTQSTSGAHWLGLATSAFLTFQHVAMEVGNHIFGIRDITMNLGNDVVTNIGSGLMHISRWWRQRFSRCAGCNIKQ